MEKNTVDTAVKSKKEQADNFILDIMNDCHLNNEQILNQIERLYNSPNREWVNMIIVIGKANWLKILIRK